jgi:hypothetical protein
MAETNQNLIKKKNKKIKTRFNWVKAGYVNLLLLLFYGVSLEMGL